MINGIRKRNVKNRVLVALPSANPPHSLFLHRELLIAGLQLLLLPKMLFVLMVVHILERLFLLLRIELILRLVTYIIIHTYLLQLWGTASTSNIEILERFQSKALCMMVNAPWYVPNTIIRRDLQTPAVKEEILRYSFQYSARLSAHPNGLIVN
jgi:hypothetical protein